MADAALLRRKVGRGGGNSYSLFKARLFGGPGVPASELFGGLRILSEAAELPLPLPSPGNRIWRPPFSFLSFLAAFFFSISGSC